FSSVAFDRFEAEMERLAGEREPGATILLGTNLERAQIARVAERQPNLVVLDTCFDTLNVNFIVMNNRMGAYQAAQHLLKLGHRRIGFVQSASRMHNFDRRKLGFFDALQDAGIPPHEVTVVTAPPTVISAQEDI